MAGATKTTRSRTRKTAGAGGPAGGKVQAGANGAARNKQYERGLTMLRKGHETAARGLELMGIGTAGGGARNGPS